MKKTKAHKNIVASAFSLFVGFPIVFLILAISVGGFGNAISILFMSIICTAGIGLVVWIPVCWLVGFVVMAIFYMLFPEPFEPTESTESILALPGMEKPDPALMRYITSAKSQGMTDGEVTRMLRQAGWSVQSIALASSAVE